MAPRQKDYLDQAKAQQLAAQLRAYWRERGLIIRTWLEEIPSKTGCRGTTAYAVRSDLDVKLALSVKRGSA